MQRKLLIPLVAALAGSWIGIASAADQPEVIRFGLATVGKGGIPFASSSVTSLAHQRQAIEEELKAEGIKVEWTYFKGAGPAVNEALANKQLDFAWQGDLPAAVGKAGGLNTRLIAADGLLSANYLVVPSDSQATTLEDLKGKKVALFKGTNLQLATARTLKQAGLSDRDFRTINMDFPTAAAALASKDIDGAWLASSAFDLQANGIGRIIYDTRAVDARLTRQTHVLVRGEFEQQHPEIVQKVVNGLVKTAAWVSAPENEDAAFELWAKSGTPVDSLRAEQGDLPLARRYSPRLDEFFIDRYRATARESKGLGLIRGDIDVAQWIEPKYVNSAIEQLGLQSLWPQYDTTNQPLAR